MMGRRSAKRLDSCNQHWMSRGLSITL